MALDVPSVWVATVTLAMLAGMLIGFRAARKRVKDAEMFAHAERTLHELRAENARRASTPDDDAAALRMLKGATFAPGARVILPTGIALTGVEAQLYVELENTDHDS